MTAPGWYFKEAIEEHLERLGAQTWTYQEDPAHFRVTGQTGEGAVELSSSVYGAVVRPAQEVLETLGRLRDDIGDERIAEALMGREPAADS
jgi:hypothetical protein